MIVPYLQHYLHQFKPCRGDMVDTGVVFNVVTVSTVFFHAAISLKAILITTRSHASRRPHGCSRGRSCCRAQRTGNSQGRAARPGRSNARGRIRAVQLHRYPGGFQPSDHATDTCNQAGRMSTQNDKSNQGLNPTHASQLGQQSVSRPIGHPGFQVQLSMPG